MGKSTTVRKKAVTATKSKDKGRVIRLHLGTGRTWGGSMRMSSMARIMRDSALDMDVWSKVVDMSPKLIVKLVDTNAILEVFRAERVKLVQQVLERSREVYGDRGMADRWMQRPSPYLGGKAPQAMLGSLGGIAEVMTELERIDAGAFA